MVLTADELNRKGASALYRHLSQICFLKEVSDDADQLLMPI
jgi:hypothetical protein